MKYFIALGITLASIAQGICSESCETIAEEKARIIMGYDLDGSGKINVRESLAAFPVFESLLKSMTGSNNTRVAEAAFTYILNYQRLPKRPFSFATWMLRRPTWRYERTESEIYNGMAALYCSMQPPQPEGEL